MIDPVVIAHVMKHPARGRPWTLRELAPKLGCAPSTLSHMQTGARASFPLALVERFAEAVGVEMRVLFKPAVSADSDADSEASVA